MTTLTHEPSRRAVGVEWPTLAVLGFAYSAWAALTVLAGAHSPWIAVPLLALLLALHSSLQHEAIHGHPFRDQRLNDVLVFPALGLLLPYERFREMHLAHHYDPLLTDPHDDPETNYLDPATWQSLPRPARVVLAANNTLLGRMAVGPLLGMVWLWRKDLAAIRAGDHAVARAYWLHALAVLPVALWLGTVATVPFWAYFLACWLALSILRVRTFLEHQAHERAGARSVVIEDRGPLAFLFLNNNFHAVHHAHPQLPWYRLPGEYARRRDEFLRRNDGYRYGSYAEVFIRYLFRRKDPVAHPIWTPPEPSSEAALHPVTGRPLRR
jgi:fatty acid desaturase